MGCEHCASNWIGFTKQETYAVDVKDSKQDECAEYQLYKPPEDDIKLLFNIIYYLIILFIISTVIDNS